MYSRAMIVGTCLVLGWTLTAGKTLAEDRVFPGELAEGDRIDEDRKAFADDYKVELTAGQLVTISMQAGAGSDLDTYLKVAGPGGQSYYNDDAPGGGSRLVFLVPQTGEWTVTATSYGEGETGPYEVRVGVEQLREVLAEAGELTETSPVLPKQGEFYQVYTVAVEAGKRYALSLASDDFDAYAAVHFPNRGFENNDDGGDGSTNSFLVFEPTAAGDARIVATSLSRGATGKYRVVLSEIVR